MAPEPANTQTLCWAIVTSSGNLLVNAATVAPKPSVTRMMGRAQQMSVPPDANKVWGANYYSSHKCERFPSLVKCGASVTIIQ